MDEPIYIHGPIGNSGSCGLVGPPSDLLLIFRIEDKGNTEYVFGKQYWRLSADKRILFDDLSKYGLRYRRIVLSYLFKHPEAQDFEYEITKGFKLPFTTIIHVVFDDLITYLEAAYEVSNLNELRNLEWSPLRHHRFHPTFRALFPYLALARMYPNPQNGLAQLLAEFPEELFQEIVGVVANF